jgi:cholesterol transport system auxiliary component
MNIITVHTLVSRAKLLTVSIGVMSLGACSVLNKPASPPPTFHTLDGAPSPSVLPLPSSVPASQLTLLISPPRAASGFDSQRIVYVRRAHQLEYFAHSEWVDPPARMLGTLLVTTAQQTGAFAAVLPASGTAVGDLRLNTDILQLQHNFQTSPSRVQLHLRVYLTDERTRKVLAWKEFSAEAAATSDSPQGGVAAANQAVREVLAQVAQFVQDRSK